MKRPSVETIAARMDALGLWQAIEAYNFAVKPHGVAFPYFCTSVKGDSSLIKARFIMLEGWQTLHDFVRTRADVNFGFYSTPAEFPHFELVVLTDGSVRFLRYDPCYAPQEISEEHRALVQRILWEAFGVFLRLEGDPQLPLKYAEDRAVFARVEDAHGNWSDAPLPIPNPPPYQESVVLLKDLVKAVKDLPVRTEDVFHADFVFDPSRLTCEKRPRTVYHFQVYDAQAKRMICTTRVSPTREWGLRAMWQEMPNQMLRVFQSVGRVPGELRVKSGRMFRLLRPICLELPIKLSLHDHLAMSESD